MSTFTQFGVILFITHYCVIAFYTVLCNFPAVAFDHNSHRIYLLDIRNGKVYIFLIWDVGSYFNLGCGKLLLDK